MVADGEIGLGCLVAALSCRRMRMRSHPGRVGGLTWLAVVVLVLGLRASVAAAAGVAIYYDSQASDSAGQPGIWRMNLDGSGQQGFMPGGSEASWSADGTRMIYETGTAHCTQQSGGGLVMVNADGTNPVQLGGVCGDARLSPDGTMVAYESAPDSLSVLSVANPTSPKLLVPVTPGSQAAIACETALPNDRVTACSFATEPSWLGSSTVVYSDDTGEGGGLWSYPAAGASSPNQVADDGSPGGINYGISGESVNPAGTEIAVSTNLDTNNPESIMVIPVGGSTGPFIATAPPNHNYVFPEWSSDGSTIVFEDDGPNNTSTIDSVPAGGGAVTVLTANDLTARNPTYGPAPNTGGISGTVTDDVGDIPLPEGGVTVQATGSNGQVTSAMTGANGQYNLSLVPGTYTVGPVGRTFMPASRKVTLTGFTSNVDFDDEPVGMVTLGAAGLSFGVATYSLGLAPGLHGSGSGPLQPGTVVTKPLDNTSAQIQKANADGELFPIAFLDVYQPGTTNIALTYQLKNAGVEQFLTLGGQPLTEEVTISAQSATTIMVPTCQAIPAIAGVARTADALVCPLTEAQKDAALAAYQQYADEAASLRVSQEGLGCISHVDREVLAACAAIGLTRAIVIGQESEAKEILDDPPDPHFKKVAKPKQVHPKQIMGRRFKAFDRLISDLAEIGSLEAALITSANRESGAHDANSKSGVTLQRSAISRYARRIIALVGKVKRLGKAAGKAFSGLRAKGHAITVDLSLLAAGDRELAAAMRPSAR